MEQLTGRLTRLIATCERNCGRVLAAKLSRANWRLRAGHKRDARFGPAAQAPGVKHAALVSGSEHGLRLALRQNDPGFWASSADSDSSSRIRDP